MTACIPHGPCACLDSKRTPVESCDLEKSIYKQSYTVVTSPFDRASLGLFG